MRTAFERMSRLTTRLDLVLALVIAVTAVIETLGNTDAPHPGLRALLAGVAASTVAVRRTLPTTAAGVFSASMATESLALESPDELGVLLSLLVVSYSVAVHAPRREGILGAALLGMSLAVTIATDPSDSVSNIAPSALLFIGAPFGVGTIVRRRLQDVVALTLHSESLALEADAAVDAERRRIARELHDLVSHAVTLIAVQAEAGRTVIHHDTEAAARSLDAIGRVSREALDELTRLLGVLRENGEPPTSDQGLDQLTNLVDGASAAGLRITVREKGTRVPLDPGVDACAFRLVQEGLTNALRHSRDADVVIDVVHGEELRITVHSTGRANTSAYGGTGRGLVGLRERVAGLGGTFATGTRPDDSFELQATLPTRAAGLVES